jgi:hypothetical protein
MLILGNVMSVCAKRYFGAAAAAWSEGSKGSHRRGHGFEGSCHAMGETTAAKATRPRRACGR